MTGPNPRDRLPRYSERALSVLFLAVIAATAYRFYLARFHSQFTDENDHMAVGWLLTQGETLYGSIFSHHMPLPYLAAQLLAFVSPNAPASAFRLIPLLAYLLVGVLLVVSPVGRLNRPAGWLAGAAFLVLVSITLPPFLGHILLMENLEGCGLAVFLAFVSLPALLRIPCRKRDDLVGGLGAAFALSASPMALFPLAAGLLPLLTAELPNREGGRLLLLRLARLAAGAAAFALPVALWLHFYGSLKGFVADVFVFNREAYLPFVSSPGTSTATFLVAGLGEWLDLARPSSRLDSDFSHTYNLTFVLLAAGAVLATATLARGRRRPATGLSSLRLLLAPAAQLSLVFLLSRLRGFNFRALPFLILAITGASLSGALLLASAGRRRGAVVALVATVVTAPLLVLSMRHFTNRIDLLRPAIWPPQVSPIAEYVRTHTEPAERIAAFHLEPRIFLESRRRPATNAVFFLPWQAKWEALHPGEPTTCEQLGTSRPRFVFFQPSPVWGMDWSGYAGCIDRFIRENYEPLPDPAFQGSLWIRRPSASATTGPPAPERH